MVNTPVVLVAVVRDVHLMAHVLDVVPKQSPVMMGIIKAVNHVMHVLAQVIQAARKIVQQRVV